MKGRLLIARIAQVALFALVFALPFALARTWIDVRAFASTRDVLPRILTVSLDTTLVIATGTLVLWTVLFRLLTDRRGTRFAARVASIVAFLPAAYFVARRINHDFLPGITDPVSLIANAVLVPALLVLGYFVHRHLLAWQQDTWRAGRVRIAALMVLAAIPVGAHVWASRPRDAAPDVLILTIDILRADHLGCYGYERDTSPNIDAFADDAVLFENAISASTFTKTSIASLFTGVEAHRHGVYVGTAGIGPNRRELESDVLSDGFTTLAEGMWAHGLNTVGWVENAQLRSYMGFGQGFNEYYDYASGIADTSKQYARWLELWGDSARYFAYLHFLDLHGPFNPKPPFLGKFGSGTAAIEAMDRTSWIKFKLAVHRGVVVLSDEDLLELERRHDEVLAYTDAWIGRILDNLKRTGRYDNTLIVITSDHGEGFGEHGFISHSTHPYEELCHVPLIVKLPNSEHAGQRIDTMVGLIDVAPTLLEFVGATVPPTMTGASFLELLRDPGATLEPRTRVVEVTLDIAVRTDRWKLLTQAKKPDALFDLTRDPGELENVIEEHPEVAAELYQYVERSRELRAQLEPADRVTLDEETRDALEDIGYGN